MPWSRALLWLALVGSAAVSLFVSVEHYNTLDAERGILRVRSFSFSPAIQSRVGHYFSRNEPETELIWTSEAALLDGTVTVHLLAGTRRFIFHVDPGAKTVEPMDEPTRTLVGKIVEWAAVERQRIGG